MSSSPSSTRLDAATSNVRERLSFAANALRTAVTSSDTPDELADWFRPGYLLEVAADIERLLAAPALEGARDATGVLRAEEAPSVGRIMLGEHERACPRCGGEVFVPGEGDVRIPLPEGGMALGCRLCGNQWLRELPPALSRSREASPRDWPEDFAHENGQYECRCVECGNAFIGHKCRVICKTCASALQRDASGEIPDEVAARCAADALRLGLALKTIRRIANEAPSVSRIIEICDEALTTPRDLHKRAET